MYFKKIVYCLFLMVGPFSIGQSNAAEFAAPPVIKTAPMIQPSQLARPVAQTAQVPPLQSNATESSGSNPVFDPSKLSIVDLKFFHQKGSQTYYVNLMVRGNNLYSKRDPIPSTQPNFKKEIFVGHTALIQAINDAVHNQQFTTIDPVIRRLSTADTSKYTLYDADLQEMPTSIPGDSDDDYSLDLLDEEQGFGGEIDLKDKKAFTEPSKRPITPGGPVDSHPTSFGNWVIGDKASDISQLVSLTQTLYTQFNTIPPIASSYQAPATTLSAAPNIVIANVYYVHCLHGTDRTGAAITAFLMKEYAQKDQLEKWGGRAGFFQNMYIYGTTSAGGSRSLDSRERIIPDPKRQAMITSYCKNQISDKGIDCSGNTADWKQLSPQGGNFPSYVFGYRASRPDWHVLIITRHAEKLESDPEGPLSLAGFYHAQAYQTLYKNLQAYYGIEKPTINYTQLPGDHPVYGDSDSDSHHPFATIYWSLYPNHVYQDEVNANGQAAPTDPKIIDTFTTTDGETLPFSRGMWGQPGVSNETIVKNIKSNLANKSVWMTWNHTGLRVLLTHLFTPDYPHNAGQVIDAAATTFEDGSAFNHVAVIYFNVNGERKFTQPVMLYQAFEVTKTDGTVQYINQPSCSLNNVQDLQRVDDIVPMLDSGSTPTPPPPATGCPEVTVTMNHYHHKHTGLKNPYIELQWAVPDLPRGMTVSHFDVYDYNKNKLQEIYPGNLDYKDMNVGQGDQGRFVYYIKTVCMVAEGALAGEKVDSNYQAVQVQR